MVTHPEEIVWARGVLSEVLFEMGGVDLPVGMMVEVPAAALRAADFAGLIDFASIGTNDLAQYALASDRTSAAVSTLAPLDDPAVWDLIELTCRGLPNIPVAVCGNLASEPMHTARLVRLGVTELSVRPPMVAQVKQAVRRV
jgi:phosphoenolpyruvate-protein kinase (PTS system EI component)